MRHVLVRHEQGAGFAADGFARLSGRPAAAFVISGPGLTNIMTAVAQAYSDSVPLLVVASAPVRASFTKQWGVLHELGDQAALAAGVFGVARSARSAEDVRDHLRLCLASLRTGRPRPAYLEIPLDVLAEDDDAGGRSIRSRRADCRRRVRIKSTRPCDCSALPRGRSSLRAAARAAPARSCTAWSRRWIARW